MIDIPHEFEHLSTRGGFNNALSHFRTVSSIIDEFEGKYNIADVLNERLAKKELDSKQVVPIVNALLNDKYAYTPYSHTMTVRIEDFSYIHEQVSRWKAVDITLLYFHPDLGPVVINPKNKEHFSSINELKENELVTIYAGGFGSELDQKLVDTAVKAMRKLLDGKKAKSPESLLKGSFTFKPIKREEPKKKKRSTRSTRKKSTTARAESRETAAEEAPQKKEAEKSSEPSGARRMTPFYSVPVTNELFHNGNVEAWKKIIQSYNAKHPNLEVYIYYEGERIHDIASLFKWGKVKHGSSILFAVAGEQIKDVAKLQRYLRQGASPQFEAFLKGPSNKILNLF
jgi:hypothetical protein